MSPSPFCRIVWCVVSLVALAGCGTRSEQKPVESRKRSSVIPSQGLPTLGDYLPPLDNGRIEFADFGRTKFTCGLRKSSDEIADPDVFFIDINHNGRLEQNEILKGTETDEQPLEKIHYGAIDIPLRDRNQARTHRVFVWYGTYSDLYLVFYTLLNLFSKLPTLLTRLHLTLASTFEDITIYSTNRSSPFTSNTC